MSEPLPQDVKVPDGVFDVCQDDDWYLDPLYDVDDPGEWDDFEENQEDIPF